MIQRLKYPDRFRAVLRATAPLVGILYDGGCFRIERQVLRTFLDNPAVSRAEITQVGDGPLTLVLTGSGLNTRVAYKLYAYGHRCGGQEEFYTLGLLSKWAAAQRKRRSKGRLTPLSRRQAALDKRIAKLEGRLGRGWSYNPPRNPMLEVGKPVPCAFEVLLHRAYSGNGISSEREQWQQSYQEKALRRKVSQLGLCKWKQWGPLRDALTRLGITLSEKPTWRYRQALRLREVNSSSLITACHLTPHGREKDTYGGGKMARYREQRSWWLESKRERAALGRELADLRELREMPDKLMESSVGLPEGVEIDTAAQEDGAE